MRIKTENVYFVSRHKNRRAKGKKEKKRGWECLIEINMGGFERWREWNRYLKIKTIKYTHRRVFIQQKQRGAR